MEYSHPRAKISLLPSNNELAYISAFFFLWLLPVTSSLAVSLVGLKFSFIGMRWQNQYQLEISFYLASIFLVGIACSCLVIAVLKLRVGKAIASKLIALRFSKVEKLVVLSIAVIAFIGVILSFGGLSAFQAYNGPRHSWLGNGAWSIILLFSCILMQYRRGALAGKNTILFLPLSVYFPILLLGSRIDYISLMLCAIIFLWISSEWRVFKKVLATFFILSYLFISMLVVGNFRYAYQNILHNPLGPAVAPLTASESSSKMIYLSTLGDLGASIFQVVGLTSSNPGLHFGIKSAVFRYGERLLPGPLFPDRPGDISTFLPEPIGGGAMHALAEGFYIDGLRGAIVVAIVFSLLIAVSTYLSGLGAAKNHPVGLLVIYFPWLLVIRGGWYQFFSVFKSLEILIFFIIIIWLLNRADFSAKSARLFRN